jgi:L-ribulokinase
MAKAKFVIGLDFGTDSVRSLIADVSDGKEIATSVSYYKRWGKGLYCDPSKNQFRHHPADYKESMTEALTEVINMSPKNTAENIIGIGVDTTGSTPAPVDREGKILAEIDRFADDPDAMFVLWKDHSAVEEAEHINDVSRSWGGIDYTKYSGGVYSSEWFFSKILHIIKENTKVKEAYYSWVELADWIPALLTGNIRPSDIKRSRCAAGHKAMWHASWDGLPSEEFLASVDPMLSGLRERLYINTYTSDNPAGLLSKEWAEKLGLAAGIPVAVGAFDAHMGAVGAGIREGTLVKIIGTSCCDMAVSPPNNVGDKTVAGICGQVDGSILPGHIGFEAGQSSFGDAYAWFKDILMWPVDILISDKKRIKDADERVIPALSVQAEKISPRESGLIALDWLNGRRTPYADQKLKGALAGLSLGTTAPGIFRAIVEATAFGSKAIIDRFREESIKIEEVVAIGGIPQKSPFVMQVLSDAIEMPVKVAGSSQAVALGAAVFASVASGYYSDTEAAQKNMASPVSKTYNPVKENVKIYQGLYRKYREMGKSLEDILRDL